MSHDLEDIVTVIDGRAELVNEVRHAESYLQQYLSKEFGKLMADPDFVDALPGHLLPDSASQFRVGLVIERIQQVILKT